MFIFHIQKRVNLHSASPVWTNELAPWVSCEFLQMYTTPTSEDDADIRKVYRCYCCNSTNSLTRLTLVSAIVKKPMRLFTHFLTTWQLTLNQASKKNSEETSNSMQSLSSVVMTYGNWTAEHHVHFRHVGEYTNVFFSFLSFSSLFTYREESNYILLSSLN